MPNSLQGKTILVTGATNGIGLVTARELAKMGAQVTIIGRKAEKTAVLARQIEAAAGASVESIVGDLSVMEGVKQVAKTFREKHSQLHVLVNNAGGMFTKRVLTADGFEYTFALNHINYFLMTELLLDMLKASAPSRIINVSSNAHERAKIDFDNLQGQKRYIGLEAYGQSKLANLLFTYELARQLEGSGVTANAVHPGFVQTGFARNNGPIYNVGTWIAGKIFGINVERGAQTSIYLASSPEVEGISGKYFVDCKAVDSKPQSYDRAAAERLWEVSLELTEKARQNN
jgi:NAD(P)-dependent dehydrogenase (short-subunit alcohol dehydrogenase family)